MKIMENEFPINPEEAEKLLMEKELLAKKEQGQNLEENEEETLKEISSLKEEIQKRFLEKNTPENQNKALQSAVAQKEHFREKYAEALKLLEGFQKNIPQEKKVVTDVKGIDPLEIVKLSKALEGLSEEEVEFVLRNSPDRTPENIVKTLNDEFVKTAIKGLREKVAKENNIPQPSSPGSFSSEEVNPDKIASMSKEEHRKLFEKDVKRKEGGAVGI